MPSLKKENALNMEKLDSQTVISESQAPDEKSWLFDDALKLIGQFLCSEVIVHFSSIY